MLFHRLILVGGFCLLAIFDSVADADRSHGVVNAIDGADGGGLESINAADGSVERKLGYRRR